MLLVFLKRGGAGAEGWFLVSDGTVAARGEGEEALPRADRTVLVAPGDEVALHWLDLPPGLTRPQAAAAARLMAGELSAEPIADMHVAVGREPAEGALRCVALVPNALMAAWLDGRDPDAIVPETLLVEAPAEGWVRYDGGAVPLFRGPADAFAMEPDLAVHLLGEAQVGAVEQAEFEAGLAATAQRPELDLRQGPFARRRQWNLEPRRMRRMALLALALVAVTLAIQLAAILRYTYAADRIEGEARAVTGGEDLRARLDALGGTGGGYGAASAALFAAVRQTPNIELGSINYDRGTLRAQVLADQPATIAALVQRIEASGLAAEAGAARVADGRQSAEVTVRSR